MSAKVDSDEIRILVVEDNLAFRNVLEQRLLLEGYRVLVASDGREGMRAIVAEEPDLVLSDWMMPHVDGLELCQAVKTGLCDAAPYFILLTAKGEINDELLGLEMGADDFLTKPCDMGELMARVRAGLRNVALARELRRTHSNLNVAEHELSAARAELSRVVDRETFPADPPMHPECPSCGEAPSGDLATAPSRPHRTE